MITLIERENQELEEKERAEKKKGRKGSGGKVKKIYLDLKVIHDFQRIETRILG